MTFERWNTLLRTGFLGLLTCVLVVLAFQVSGLVKTTAQDEQDLAAQSAELLRSAKAFVPAEPLNMHAVNGVIGSVQQQVNAAGLVISNANVFEQKLNESADLLKAPCVPGPCGLIFDAAKTLNSGRHMLGEVEIGVHNFDSHEDSLFDQEKETWSRANTALDGANALLNDPAGKAILDHVATGSATLDHMLDTTDKVETKVTKCSLHPSFACKITGWILPVAQITGALLH